MGFHGDHHHRLRNGNPSLKRLKRSHLGNQMVVLCFVLKMAIYSQVLEVIKREMIL